MFASLLGFGLASSARADPVLDEPTDLWADRVVWTAGDQVNLRRKPSVAADVVARLPLGAEVKIVAPGPEEQLEGRADRWYEVIVGEARGFLWGGTLTSARFALDFDGDGVAETATAALGSERELIVRIAAGNGRVAVAKAGRGTSWVEVVEAPELGMPMLRVAQTTETGAHTALLWYQGGTIGQLEWDEFESETGWSRTDVRFPAPRTLHRVVREGVRAADGSGVERLEIVDLAFAQGRWAPVADPVRRERAVGRPSEGPRGHVELTPSASSARFTADLDGDAGEEAVEIGLVDHRVVVTVIDGATSTRHTFEPFHQVFSDKFLDRALVGFGTEAGPPLIVVVDPGEEMCGSTTTTTWLSYEGGALRVALEARSWADAPYFATDAVSFDPANRSVEVVHTQGSDSASRRTRAVRVLQGGVYALGDR